MDQSGEAAPSSTHRNLLIPVVDAEPCTTALRWTIGNIYREGDEFIFLHVLPPEQHFSAGTLQPTNLQEMQAQTFIQERFVPMVESLQAKHSVSIVQADADCDSIGAWICHKAEEAAAALVVMAAHHKGQLLSYVLGSTTKYCLNRCRRTVLVSH
mmetsp:Transcript_15640/g.47172  ORF Transcript_15640/g.47172 Transcript_15640/m.47172 type:complete len:155 (+) Transcript_15640:128-592(+)|eukprot:CAMPEP_0206141068 /NCGR_PEP_ID=MMETSP1473-20131121/11701_1 /ASSEMBLY_ACC=CAM_ASM_001109 /TAXON_ID=1461547 /ORGANISM="Stichococcus sp, Strain RCC1054" /LENGTH=154 /DNA_ID=CAMNT_0053535471 /DNA_START=40 /DNA_END=504 /DNA_ORIENTATION=+